MKQPFMFAGGLLLLSVLHPSTGQGQTQARHTTVAAIISEAAALGPLRTAVVRDSTDSLPRRVAPFMEWNHPVESVVPGDSGPPFKALARRLRHIPIWIVHGERDDVVPVEQSRQAAAALEAAGAPSQYLELIGIDHNSWDPAYGSPRLMGWLFAQRRGKAH